MTSVLTIAEQHLCSIEASWFFHTASLALAFSFLFAYYLLICFLFILIHKFFFFHLGFSNSLVVLLQGAVSGWLCGAFLLARVTPPHCWMHLTQHCNQGFSMDAICFLWKCIIFCRQTEEIEEAINRDSSSIIYL